MRSDNTQEGMNGDLAVLQQPFGYWWKQSIHLFKNNVIVLPATLQAGLVECDFTGYTPVDLVFTGSGLWDDGEQVSSYPAHTFTCSGDGALQYAYGFFMADPGLATNPRLAGNFSQPYLMSKNGKSITVQIQRFVRELVQGTVTGVT